MCVCERERETEIVDLCDLPSLFSDGVSGRLPLKGLPALSKKTKTILRGLIFVIFSIYFLTEFSSSFFKGTTSLPKTLMWEGLA